MRILTADGRGRARLGVLATLVAALALAGATTIGYAGTGTNGTVSATFTSVLNDNTTTLVKGTPTPGKNIGYTYSFQNTGANTINHLVLNLWISGSSTGSPKVGAPVYVAVSDPGVSCSGSPALKCTDSQLVAGGTFTITAIFSTDSSAAGGSSIYPFFSGTYSPESQNTSNSRDQSTKSFSADNSGFVRKYTDSANGSVTQSLALPGDPLGANAGSFTSLLSMPPGFLQNNHYAGVTLQNVTGQLPPDAATLCKTCQPFLVATTIPLAKTLTTAGNPFYDGTSTTEPYTWSFTIPVPNGFKPAGVYHTEDDGTNPTALLACATVDGSFVPSTDPPGLCIESMTVDKKKNLATYTGLGLANGNTWGY